MINIPLPGGISSSIVQNLAYFHLIPRFTHLRMGNSSLGSGRGESRATESGGTLLAPTQGVNLISWVAQTPVMESCEQIVTAASIECPVRPYVKFSA